MNCSFREDRDAYRESTRFEFFFISAFVWTRQEDGKAH